jgi:predicted cupin superfamily sugar epimerase
MYHHYLGEPLDVLLLYPDGRSEVQVVGPDLAAGMRPQLLVPGGTFHAARITGDGSYSLLGTSVWLRAEPSDVELGKPAELAKTYPASAIQIAEYAS